MARIGILAGGGRLPLMIAESVAARGAGVHIVGIEGEADPAIARFPHTWVNWGQIGRMVATLRGEGGAELVIAGAVTRPDLWRIRPDAGFFTSLPQILRLLAGGDDSVLTRVVRFFEGKGLQRARRARGGARPAGGCWTHRRASTLSAAGPRRRRARLCRAAGAWAPSTPARRWSWRGGKVLAIEGAEGTDAMLERVAAPAPAAAGRGAGAACWRKGRSPARSCASTCRPSGRAPSSRRPRRGLAGVAVEAGAVLVLDRAETIRVADAAGLCRPWPRRRRRRPAHGQPRRQPGASGA